MQKVNVTIYCGYEKWFLFFQIMWGRTQTRWEDIADKEDGFGVGATHLLRVFDLKMDVVMTSRESWPTFASFEEDKEFSGDAFKNRYENICAIFWDITNVHLPKPSNA